MRGSTRDSQVLQWSGLALTLWLVTEKLLAQPVHVPAKSSLQEQSETLSMGADRALEITRKALLAELKNAKRYRIASREQDAELEKERYGWPGQKLNFNHAKLNAVCKRVGAQDGFLILGHNFNQSANNAKELLRTPLIADAGKGLRVLAVYDANGDGRIAAYGYSRDAVMIVANDSGWRIYA